MKYLLLHVLAFHTDVKIMIYMENTYNYVENIWYIFYVLPLVKLLIFK